MKRIYIRNRLTDRENKPVKEGSAEGQIGFWDEEIQTAMYKIDKEQGYIV